MVDTGREYVAISFDAAAGGRISQITVGGFDLLFNPGGKQDPTAWGAYPMVPWAGRIDHGNFPFRGQIHHMPPNFGDHAIHGTGFTSEWKSAGPNQAFLQLSDPWPFGGSVEHSAKVLTDGPGGVIALELTITSAGQAMPVMLGWHPWFNRQLTNGGPTAQLHFPNWDAAEMYVVADSMIPTGELISPPAPGPWDHPFRSVTEPITLLWPGQLELKLRSSCDHWVVFDQLDHALCVEPQSGPPNVFNSADFDVAPTILEAESQLAHSFTIAWTLL